MPCSEISAPFAGTLIDLSEVPDPVFARAMVGPGFALRPDFTPGTVTPCLSPVPGVLIKALDHAYICGSPEAAVMVHCGIETVSYEETWTRLVVPVGGELTCATTVIEVDFALARGGGYDLTTPVIGVEAQTFSFAPGIGPGVRVTPGQVVGTCTWADTSR